MLGMIPLAYLYADIASIEVIGDYTVQFNLSRPSTSFIYCMDMPIVPEGCDENQGWLAAPFGYGPYVVAPSDQGAKLLKTNPAYFGTSPNIQELAFSTYDSEGALVSALMSDEIDMLLSPIDPAETATFLESKDFSVRTIPSNSCLALAFSQKSALLSQKELRLALVHLTDKQGICETIYAGNAQPADNFFIPGYWYFQERGGYAYDVDRAASILTEANWTDSDNDGILDKEGSQLSFRVLVDANVPEHMAALNTLRETWEQCGINASIEAISGDELAQKLSNPWDYDLALINRDMLANPDLVLTSVFAAGSAGNIGGYTYSELDTQLNQARVESNRDALMALYGSVADFIDGQILCYPIAYEPYVVIHSSRLDDYTPYANGSTRFCELNRKKWSA